MDHKSKPRSNGVLHFEGDNPHDDGCVQQQNRRTEETLATDTVIIDVAIDVVIATYHDSFYTPTPSNISLFPLPPSPYPIILPLCHTPPQFNLPMMVAGFLCLVLTAAALTFSDSIRQNSLFVKPDRAQSNTRMPDRAQSNTPDLDHVQSNALTLTFFGRIRRFFVWAQSNLFVWAQSNLRVGADYSVYYVATHGLAVFHVLSTFSNSFIIEVRHSSVLTHISTEDLPSNTPS